MQNETLDTIREAIENAAKSHKVCLVEAALKGPAQNPIVELRFDSLTHPDAITADELDETSEWVSHLMDELDPFASSYTVEVSSPGLDRLLVTKNDFSRHLGENVLVQLIPTGEQGVRSKYSGTLEVLHDSSISVVVDGTTYEIELEKIREARLKPSTDALFNKRKDA